MGFLNQSDEILSVGEFSRRFKMLVKSNVPELWLGGEVSNVKTYGSGHTYFTLKDSEASISAVLFKGNARGMSFQLREGMKIFVFGEISVYEARGGYQIIVKVALPDGTGDLAAKFNELKKKLADEGLFDAERKKEIPMLPKNIAVITSPTGAAIRDFCRILSRRAWRGNVWILPSRVQGAEAAKEMVSQLQFAKEHEFENKEKFDLIILMRGGGSLEDLWPFNEEILARAVAGCDIPTISAVGHEIDFTLCDFASDLRAETPSAAAEHISSAYIEASNSVRETFSNILKTIKFSLSAHREKLSSASGMLRLNSPKNKIHNYILRVDETNSRLGAVVKDRLSEFRLMLSKPSEDFVRLSPKSKLSLYSQRLDACQKHLEILGIDSALRRGFSIATNRDGKFICRAGSISEGDSFNLKFFDGEVESVAKKTSVKKRTR